ncbi:hypothetical protein AB6A40_007266 [Gnathostoma spinigerum]|uniref:Uncharacterized protein n=1 Tax=Gnathostoma spinigerum TaxID=75299 RepID=A0ABD6EVF5_9BILA
MTTPSEGYFVLQTWPESERMRCYLSAESQESDKCYTMPGIKSNPVTVDSNAVTAGDLLNTNVAHSNPPANMDGIKQLIGSGNFRAALDFTATLLTSLGQGFGMTGVPSRNTAETLELWTCRFQLLQALEMHQWLIDELAAFEELDAPDLYFQFYPSVYGAERKGSLVPFSLRLIHAECLRFTKMPWKSLKRIDVLEKNVAEVIECLKHTSLPSALAGVWQSRLMLVQSLRARILVALNV